MIDSIAWLYVNILEPFGILLFWLAIGVVLWAFVNILRDPKSGSSLINTIAKFFFRILKGILVYIGKVLQVSIKVLLNSLKVIFAAVRDFWSSKI